MTRSSQYRLTRAVTRFLDVLRVLTIVCLIVWPIAAAAMSLGQLSRPDSWGVDIQFYTGLEIDLASIPTESVDARGVRDPVIKGNAELNIDTSSRKVLLVFTLITELGGLVALYVLIQLRGLFNSFAEGTHFSTENSRRFRKVGIATIVWTLIYPVIQYFGGREIIDEIVLNTAAIQLSPSFELDGVAIFIGLALLTLSGVMEEAAVLHEDQQLTI